MKTISIITLLSFTLMPLFAGNAGNVNISGTSLDSINTARGSNNIAIQKIQSAKVTGSVNKIIIDAQTGTNINSADGSGNTAIQRVQSADIAGSAGTVIITGRTKDNTNIAKGSGAHAEQNIKSVIVPEGTSLGSVHVGGNIDANIVNIADSETKVQNIGSVIAQ